MGNDINWIRRVVTDTDETFPLNCTLWSLWALSFYASAKSSSHGALACIHTSNCLLRSKRFLCQIRSQWNYQWTLTIFTPLQVVINGIKQVPLLTLDVTLTNTSLSDIYKTQKHGDVRLVTMWTFFVFLAFNSVELYISSCPSCPLYDYD